MSIHLCLALLAGTALARPPEGGDDRAASERAAEVRLDGGAAEVRLDGGAAEVGLGGAAAEGRAERVPAEGAAAPSEGEPPRVEAEGGGTSTGLASETDAGAGAEVPPGGAAAEPARQTVVTGARPARSASESTVERDVVDAAPRLGATDLLRLVPGLVASQHSGEGKAHQLFLRGFDAIHGQDVELSVAGIPVNEVSHIHALGYADLNWLIPEVVRTVQVTEGSYRAFQGDFAVAGSVRYELGLDERGVALSASYGSFNRLRLFAGVRPVEDPSTFAAVEYVQGDGFGPQRAFGRVSVLGQARIPLGPATLRLVAGSAGARFDSPGVVREDAYQAGTAGFFDGFGLRQGGSSSRHQLLLGVELPSALGRTTVEVWGFLSDLRLRNNFTGFLAHAEGDGLEQVHGDAAAGLAVRHAGQLTLGGQRLRVELGVGGRRDGIAQLQRGYRESDGTPFRDDVEAELTQSAGHGWLELSWQPGPWRFMLGGRIDVLHFEVLDAAALDDPDRFGSGGSRRAALGAHLGLKAAVERQLGPVTVFLNYGDGFRSPQARALSDGERAPFVSVRGGELGAAARTAWLTAQLALFGTWVEQDFFFDHTVGTTVYTGATLRGGGQATVTLRPLAGLVVAASATVTTARVLRTGALLPYFAPVVGRLDAGYQHPFEALGIRWVARAGAGLTVLGPRPLPFDEFSRPVVLLDARAGLRAGAVELTLDVQNLLDARWRDGEFVYSSRWDPGAAASLVPARQFTAGAPLTLLATLEVHL